ncbi:MAG: hypothetical protein IT546_15770 [Caulobacteraceae bacterium]|nr:hypothetical protein [Caulobacteraceae bacterium]
MALRFRLDGKVYSVGALEDVSLRDVMLFNTQAADMGLAATWADVERIAEEMSAADKDEAEKHPDALLMLGVTIWATRRIAGDEVTFGDAVDFPLSALVWLPDTEDRKPGKGKARKGSKSKPKASAAADVPPEPSASTIPPTSEQQSSSE